MFSLIITIISIALVAALAAATIYYGGSSYTESKDKADAARLVNEGMQVKAAAEFHRAERGELPTTLDQMVEREYLKGTMGDTSWRTVDGYALVSGVPEARCLMANQQLGIETIPSCDDPGFANKPVCCDDGVAATP